MLGVIALFNGSLRPVLLRALCVLWGFAAMFAGDQADGAVSAIDSAAIGALGQVQAKLAETGAPDPRGIFVFSNDVGQLSASFDTRLVMALGQPGVDGIVIDIGWDTLEPALGQFRFAKLDQWINQALTQGLKIVIAINAGQSIPAWMFQPVPGGAAVAPIAFTVTPHGGATNVCIPITLAAPWDMTYLAQWDALVAAVSAHLKSTGTYNNVTALRLTGINRTTEELRLPAETAQTTGLDCVTDAIATWQSVGYRPSKLLQGWNSILTSFQKSFPDKFFSVAIIPQNAFPRIAEDGSVITGTVPDQNLPLLAAASQVFPGHLLGQFDFLMPGVAAPALLVQDAQALHMMLAFQTNEYLGTNGAGCSEPITTSVPCTASTFLALLQTGIYPRQQSDPLRAQDIEVFVATS